MSRPTLGFSAMQTIMLQTYTFFSNYTLDNRIICIISLGYKKRETIEAGAQASLALPILIVPSLQGGVDS